MILFTDLVKQLTEDQEGKLRVTISEDWMQGRTTYGGLSAALCLAAVQKKVNYLPPLRSAQVNFIGPAGGEVSFQHRIMRQGRSVSFIEVEMVSEKGLATHAVFCFGAARESKIDTDYVVQQSFPCAEQSPAFFVGQLRPNFTHHFDVALAQGGIPASGSDQTDHYLWVRHKDQKANDVAALIALADMPPPAVLPTFKEFAPISSINWMLNFMSDSPQSPDHWWLLRSQAEHARDGYSSQHMEIWNSNKELIVTGRQCVAIFY